MITMASNMGGTGYAALRRGAVAGLFLALAFTAGVASGGDNAAWVSYSGVPSAMHPGDTATVTVKMKNTGTTTWETTVVTETDGSTQTTTRTSYSLDAVGHGWGVSGVAVSGSVAPNATHSFEFTITGPETAGSYVFQWRMSRTTVVTGQAYPREIDAGDLRCGDAEPHDPGGAGHGAVVQRGDRSPGVAEGHGD